MFKLAILALALVSSSLTAMPFTYVWSPLHWRDDLLMTFTADGHLTRTMHVFTEDTAAGRQQMMVYTLDEEDATAQEMLEWMTVSYINVGEVYNVIDTVDSPQATFTIVEHIGKDRFGFFKYRDEPGQVTYLEALSKIDDLFIRFVLPVEDPTQIASRLDFYKSILTHFHCER